MQLVSTITCPACGHRASETMPTDACMFFYVCKGCGMRLKPKKAIAACFAPMETFLARQFRKRGRKARIRLLQIISLGVLHNQ